MLRLCASGNKARQQVECLLPSHGEDRFLIKAVKTHMTASLLTTNHFHPELDTHVDVTLTVQLNF